MLPLRNWTNIFADSSFIMFWLLFNFLIYAAFEITVSTNSHTRYIKLPERNKVLMVHDSINKTKWLLP
jgi:hypothetical protein